MCVQQLVHSQFSTSSLLHFSFHRRTWWYATDSPLTLPHMKRPQAEPPSYCQTSQTICIYCSYIIPKGSEADSLANWHLHKRSVGGAPRPGSTGEFVQYYLLMLRNSSLTFRSLPVFHGARGFNYLRHENWDSWPRVSVLAGGRVGTEPCSSVCVVRSCDVPLKHQEAHLELRQQMTQTAGILSRDSLGSTQKNKQTKTYQPNNRNKHKHGCAFSFPVSFLFSV